MASANPTTSLVSVRPENPALWLKPDEPLMASGYDWSWCYVAFGTIKGFPQYRVTDRGIVYSRRTRISLVPHWTALKPKTIKSGHLYVNLRHNNMSRMRGVHCLVMEAFWGLCPEGMEVCHNNGNSSDNRLNNLRWDTHYNNLQDRRAHGTILYGMRHQNSRLTDEIVLEIRRRLSQGESRRVMADEFGITMQHVHKIWHRILWPHI